MKVLWTDDAIADWQNIASYIAREFGETSFNEFDKATDEVEKQISEFPESGEEIRSRKNPHIKFRFVVINKLSKMIYHVANETVYIDIFWEVRQDPKRLNQRLSNI